MNSAGWDGIVGCLSEIVVLVIGRGFWGSSAVGFLYGFVFFSVMMDRELGRRLDRDLFCAGMERGF